MADLTGKTVELLLDEHGMPQERFQGCWFKTGDRGTVLRESRHENGWLVRMNGVTVLFFTDELKEVERVQS